MLLLGTRFLKTCVCASSKFHAQSSFLCSIWGSGMTSRDCHTPSRRVSAALRPTACRALESWVSSTGSCCECPISSLIPLVIKMYTFGYWSRSEAWRPCICISCFVQLEFVASFTNIFLIVLSVSSQPRLCWSDGFLSVCVSAFNELFGLFSADGTTETISGTAMAKDPSEPAKLLVSFFESKPNIYLFFLILQVYISLKQR